MTVKTVVGRPAKCSFNGFKPVSTAAHAAMFARRPNALVSGLAAAQLQNFLAEFRREILNTIFAVLIWFYTVLRRFDELVAEIGCP